MFRKKILPVFLCAFLIMGVFSGCQSKEASKPVVITTLFPQFDFVRQLCGDDVELVSLLPPGTESHSYDPTPKDIQKIAGCDLFFYTGDDMEPWVKAVLSSAEGTNVIDLSKGIPLISEEHHEETEEHEHHHENDPHIWLNMKNAQTMLNTVAQELSKILPQSAQKIEQNRKDYFSKLDDLDKKFEETVKSAGEKSVVFGGRFAYAYFAERYNLKYETVFSGCSTDVEPSAKKVEEITRYIKDNNIKYIFHEELSDPKVARSISETTGVQLAEFSTAHNVSQEQFSAGTTFWDIMNQNLENLKNALG